METYSKKKGRIIVVILIAILVLPVCYALYKDYLVRHVKFIQVESPTRQGDSVK